jgi:zinc protease
MTTQRLDTKDGTVVFLEESHALPLVTITIATRSGAAHDPPEKTGLARVTTRLLMRGCEGADARKIEETLDSLGAEAAEEVSHASASVGAQGIVRNVDALVDLLSRVLGAPLFAEAEVARLVREMDADLLEVRDDDRSLAERALRGAIFGDHIFGRLTTRASLAKITRDDVRGFHAKHFTKKNIVIAFAGDVTPDQSRALAEKLVARLPHGEAVADPTPEPVEKTGRRLVFVDKPERTQTQIFLGALGTSAKDEDHFSLLAADAILGGSFTSRLMREVRSKRGWSYGASSRLDVARRRHWFIAHTFPAATDAAPCIALELDLIENYAAKGISARELSFIKKFLVRSYAFEIDTASKRVHQALDIEIMDWPADYHSGYVEKTKAVELDAANAAIKARIHPENLAIVMVGTAAQILDKVKAAIPNLASTEVVPFDTV